MYQQQQQQFPGIQQPIYVPAQMPQQPVFYTQQPGTFQAQQQYPQQQQFVQQGQSPQHYQQQQFQQPEIQNQQQYPGVYFAQQQPIMQQYPIPLPPQIQQSQYQQSNQQQPPQYPTQYIPQQIRQQDAGLKQGLKVFPEIQNINDNYLPNNGNQQKFPVIILCPSCNQKVTTFVKTSIGVQTCLVGCCCFLIPCCMDEFKDRTHYCPNCKAKVGKKQYKICC
ncbi:transmembrane protein i1, putative [Ichthyophthirius multifiliis]|uniref:Transmembrane protein i1, putative n=1 Tax=Ichthyophthirius multifiliis TaxID=5932 RepID=G0R2G1_ICHMU|nr:transmembrane protein i1, putative [Ichthyophthirius multifiliis]EGR28346.1 transmembrane protein i1, putative [Ichthyophthirius multifiliis]|eukprot:XP_004027691.1 transmembrane protein i1, putative [Ichthyophthirius multifiliis]